MEAVDEKSKTTSQFCPESQFGVCPELEEKDRKIFQLTEEIENLKNFLDSESSPFASMMYEFGKTLEKHLMKEEIKTLRDELSSIRKQFDAHLKECGEVRVLHEMSKNECKDLILKEIDNEGKIYPSDFAIKYNIDYYFVKECFEELKKEGILGSD